MEEKKSLDLFALIAAICFVVQILADVVDTIHLEYSYNFWGYLWIILTLAMAVALFLKHRLALMVAAGATALRWLLLSICFGISWYRTLMFLAFAALAVVVFLARKIDANRYICFAPGALMLLLFLIDWVFQGAFKALFQGWLSVWNLLSDLAMVAGVALAGLWAYQTADVSEPEMQTVRNRDGTTVTAAGSEEEGYCGLAKHVLLLLFTFGIWYLIWIYRTTGFLNRVEDEEPRDPTKKLLLCMFVPFYIIYWTYQSAQRIDKLAIRKGVPSDISTLCLILAIFVGIIPPILMQDKMNAIVTADPNAPAFDTPEPPVRAAAPVYSAPINDVPVDTEPVNVAPAAPFEAEKPRDVVEELKRYKDLLDSGILTQEEFDAKKKQLLGL